MINTHRDGDESRPGLRREDTLGLVDQKVDQALVMPADLAVARVGRPDDALKYQVVMLLALARRTARKSRKYRCCTPMAQCRWCC